jgi:hypothetical protein
VNAFDALSSEFPPRSSFQTLSPGGTMPKLTGDLPTDFPGIRVSVDSTALPGGLYLSNFTFLKTIISIPYLMILRESGDPFFYRELPVLGFDFKRQENGQYTYFLTGDNTFIGLDSTFQQIAEYKAGNGYTTDLHELRLLPDGHALVLATDVETVDMSALVPGGARNAEVTGNILQELDRSGDALGQQVAVLANRVVDGGLHYALFNGTGLASGVYFCQLRAGSYMQTRKIMLVR